MQLKNSEIAQVTRCFRPGKIRTALKSQAFESFASHCAGILLQTVGCCSRASWFLSTTYVNPFKTHPELAVFPVGWRNQEGEVLQKRRKLLVMCRGNGSFAWMIQDRVLEKAIRTRHTFAGTAPARRLSPFVLIHVKGSLQGVSLCRKGFGICNGCPLRVALHGGTTTNNNCK